MQVFVHMPVDRRALLTALVATMVAWGAWGFTIVAMDPTATGWVGFALFDSTLGFAVAGSAMVIGLAVRRGAVDRERAMRIAIRQGIIVGLAVAIAVLLQSAQLLSWVNLLALVAALTLLELFIVSLRREIKSTNGFQSTNSAER